MHIKRIHEMVEKLTECTKSALEENKSFVGDYPIGDVVDMIKDLCEAEHYARIAKAMEKEEEEDKEAEKYFLKMLKEEYGMEEEDARRFYRGQPRSRTSGRFMSRGDGRRSNGGRRGYEESFIPMDMMYDYMEYPPEHWRDMDRKGMNRLYYSDGGSGGSSGGGQSGNSGGMGGSGMSGGQSSGGSSGGNSGGSRGYSDGYDDGNRRGYEDGYRDGERNGRSSGGRRDGREGRSGQSRRSYMETKEMNKGNSPQEKQEKMKELEKYMGELGSDITEMISDASPEERALLKQKMQVLVQKLG